MTERGVNDQDVETGGEQRFGTLDAIAAGTGRRGHSKTAMLVLAGRRIALRFLDILDGYQTDAAIDLVDHEQLLDAMLVQQALCVFARDILAHCDKPVPGHQLGDGLARVVGESHVAVGQNAGQPAGAALDDRDAGDLVVGHQPQRIGQRLVRVDRDWVHDHARFEFLDLADFVGLLIDAHVAVDDADSGGLRHRDRECAFCHGIHRRRDERDAELVERGAGKVRY
jgi:hypothetical protein